MYIILNLCYFKGKHFINFLSDSHQGKIFFNDFIQGVKKVPDPKQNYIGLMTEG